MMTNFGKVHIFAWALQMPEDYGFKAFVMDVTVQVFYRFSPLKRRSLTAFTPFLDNKFSSANSCSSNIATSPLHRQHQLRFITYNSGDTHTCLSPASLTGARHLMRK